MKFPTLILICIVLAAGGFIFMTQWDIHVPEHQVERTIDNERFFDSATTTAFD